VTRDLPVQFNTRYLWIGLYWVREKMDPRPTPPYIPGSVRDEGEVDGGEQASSSPRHDESGVGDFCDTQRRRHYAKHSRFAHVFAVRNLRSNEWPQSPRLVARFQHGTLILINTVFVLSCVLHGPPCINYSWVQFCDWLKCIISLR